MKDEEFLRKIKSITENLKDAVKNDNYPAFEKSKVELENLLTLCEPNNDILNEYSVILWNFTTNLKLLDKINQSLINRLRHISLYLITQNNSDESQINVMRKLYMSFKICENDEENQFNNHMQFINENIGKLKVELIKQKDISRVFYCLCQILVLNLNKHNLSPISADDLKIEVIKNILKFSSDAFIDEVELVLKSAFNASLERYNMLKLDQSLLLLNIGIDIAQASSTSINNEIYSQALRLKADILYHIAGGPNTDVMNCIKTANKLNPTITGLYFYNRMLVEDRYFDEQTYLLGLYDIISHPSCGWKHVESILNMFLLQYKNNQADSFKKFSSEFFGKLVLAIENKFSNEHQKLSLYKIHFLIQSKLYKKAEEKLTNKIIDYSNSELKILADDIIYSTINLGNNAINKNEIKEASFFFQMILHILQSYPDMNLVKRIIIANVECHINLKNYTKAAEILKNITHDFSDDIKIDILKFKILTELDYSEEALTCQQRVIENFMKKKNLDTSLDDYFTYFLQIKRIMVDDIQKVIICLKQFTNDEKLFNASYIIVDYLYHYLGKEEDQSTSAGDKNRIFLRNFEQIFDIILNKIQLGINSNLWVNMSRLVINITSKLKKDVEVVSKVLQLNSELIEKIDSESVEVIEEKIKINYLMICYKFKFEKHCETEISELENCFNKCKHYRNDIKSISEKIELKDKSNIWTIFLKFITIEIKCYIMAMGKNRFMYEYKQEIQEAVDQFVDKMNNVELNNRRICLEMIMGALSTDKRCMKQLDKLWTLLFQMNIDDENSSRISRLYYDYLLASDLIKALNEVDNLCKHRDDNVKLYICSQLWNKGVSLHMLGNNSNALKCCEAAYNCLKEYFGQSCVLGKKQEFIEKLKVSSS